MTPIPERKPENATPMRGGERAILDRQLYGLPSLKNEAGAKPSVRHYASTTDRVVLGVGGICALVAGALNPLVPVSPAKEKYSNYKSCIVAHANRFVLFKGHLWSARRCF